MIYTVTLNPAIDYYLEMNEFIEGNLNSLKNGYTLPGGKGINVSKVLKNFGVPSTALGFVGGFTGAYIKKNVSNYEIIEKFIDIKENTRINIKMKTEKSESEIAGISPNISTLEYEQFLKTIECIQENDILVLSGSVPTSLNKNIYKKIIDILPENVKVILDTRGKPLQFSLCEKVFLVKPNKDEIEEFFNEKYQNEKELIEAGKKLRTLGAENVIISLGKEGSILISEKGIYKGGVPQGKLISSVGAGDSMVSGLLYGLYLNKDIVEAYRYAIASGSSTAFSKGLTTFEDMNNLLTDIEIHKI
ncbi:MAG: 1-phosphofructokinase [Fusobacterium sp.]